MKRPAFLPSEDGGDMMTMEEEDDDEICCGVGVGGKKRRLGIEQVRALEQSFEVENRLEPDRKGRLAQELGLQPRQVAVWFQNRRARWKTKQLERDFSALKSRYDTLRVDLESLRRDNHSLVTQLSALKSKIAAGEEKPPPAMLVDGSCESDSSAVVNGDKAEEIFKVEENWEDTCGASFFADEHGSTLAWYCDELASGSTVAGGGGGRW